MTVQPWYPQIVRLARHRLTIIRSTAAWVMGQDTSSQVFHRALLEMLGDAEPIVRRNAALALVRFHDAAGRAELVGTLLPYRIRATVDGTVSIQSQTGQSVGSGALLARITRQRGSEAEIRAPFPGQVEGTPQMTGSRVAAGDPVVALTADSQQIWEALRGLYLVGRPEDLGDVERYQRSLAGAPERLQQQAALTARAIRSRAEQNPIH